MSVCRIRLILWFILAGCDGRKCTSVLENMPENNLSDMITVLKSRQERLTLVSFNRTPPEHHYRIPQSPEQGEGGHVQSEAWETQYPDVLYWNPAIEDPDSKDELLWSTIECTYFLPDVKVPSIPFESKKLNSKISESLTVYVSSGGSI